MFAHADCICNQMVSAIGRVLGDVPACDELGVTWMRREAGAVVRRLPRCCVPMTTQAFVDTYSGMKKQRYQRAAEELLVTGPTKFDASVTAFCKTEKMEHLAKTSPDPRMIQARQPKYGVRLGVYTKVMEHHMYRLTSKRGLAVIGKGLNSTQRAALLQEKMSCFPEPLVIGIDASRFDKHVGIPALKIEHYVYNKMFGCDELRDLLQQQLINHCSTRAKLRYVCNGGRMSGDMNTALGNCLLMYIYTSAAMRQTGLDSRQFELLVDGDDTLIIINACHETMLANLQQSFLHMGQEIKLESRAVIMEQVIWCQSKPVHDGEKWRFVRNWKKVLSTACAGHRHWPNIYLRKDCYYSIGVCLLAECAGIPILDTFARKLMEAGGKILRDLDQTDVYYRYKLECRTKHKSEITEWTRRSFYEAFGVLPFYQRAVEDQLRAWELPMGHLDEYPQVVGSDWDWLGPISWTEAR